MIEFFFDLLSSFWGFFFPLVSALSTTISLVIGYFLLRNKLSLYLIRDEIQNKLKEITKAQKKVRSTIPLALEEVELCFPESDIHRFATHSELKKTSEVFQGLFEDAFEASSNVSTYARLAEMLFFYLAERKEYADSKDHKIPVFKVNLDVNYMNRVSAQALSLIEIAAVKTTPLPRITKLDKLWFLPRSYKRHFSSGLASTISGVEQGVNIRSDGLFCAEFFYNVLGAQLATNQHFVNRLYFSIINGNEVLVPSLVEGNINAPLALNLSNIDRSDRESRDPDVVELFGDHWLHLIGFSERMNYGPRTNGRSYRLTYSCLTYHNYFLNSYTFRDNAVKLYVHRLIGKRPFNVSISPGEMLVHLDFFVNDLNFLMFPVFTRLPFAKRYMKRGLLKTVKR